MQKINNKKIANIVTRDSSGRIDSKCQNLNRSNDELPRKLEDMHICGFFRAIGSSLDCLGAAIIGVLALPNNLRKADIGDAE